MAENTSTRSSHGPMCSRRERQEAFRIDCEDELVWTEWRVGRESTKRLLLKNVATEHQTIHYKLPRSRAFSLPFPEPLRLAPGMTKTLLVSFCPVNSKSLVEEVEFVCEKGSFVIFLKATEKHAAVSIPHAIDFGHGAVADSTSVPFLVHNTGSLPANVLWKDSLPFQIHPKTAQIPVGGTQKFTALFRPAVAVLYEGVVVCSLLSKNSGRKESLQDFSSSMWSKDPPAPPCDDTRAAGVAEESEAATACQASKENASLRTNTRWSPEVEKEEVQQNYCMDVKGIGKIPHLHVKGKTELDLDFATVLCGTLETKTIVLENSSPVRASFEVQRVGSQPHVGPPLSAPITVCPRNGVVGPGEHFPLTFKFQSASVKEEIFHEFQVVMRIGAPIIVKVKGVVGPVEATLSSNHLHFGNVPTGRKVTKQVQLRNLSKRAVLYQFVNLDDTGFVCVDKPSGMLGPQTGCTLSFTFGAQVALQFYKRAFCLVQGTEQPLTLDLLATCYTNEERPAAVTLSHIYLRRWEALGNSPPPEGSFELHCRGNPEEVRSPPETPTSLFTALTADVSDSSRGLSVSPSLVEFKGGEVQRTLSVANRTGEKLVCIWTDSLDRKRKKSDSSRVFSVSPRRAELLPNSVTTFQVTYDRVALAVSVDFCQLEAVVCPLFNMSYRLAQPLPRSPACLSCSARGPSVSLSSKALAPHAHVAEPAIRFRPCIPGESAFHLTQLFNKGDTPLSFDILPKAADSGASSDDLIACSGPFKAWPLSGMIPPQGFHLVVLQFQPRRASNLAWLSGTFDVVFDGKELFTKHIRVYGRSWEPAVSLEPQTLEGKCRATLLARTLPTPLAALQHAEQDFCAFPSAFSDSLRLAGCAVAEPLAIEPKRMNLRAVTAHVTLTRETDELNFERTESTVDAHSMDRLLFHFTPARQKHYRFLVRVIQASLLFDARTRQTSTSQSGPESASRGSEESSLQILEFKISARAAQPVVQLLDVRSLNRPIPPSRLWTLMQAEAINAHLAREVATEDLQFLAAKGLDARASALRRLTSFLVRLGAHTEELRESAVLLTFYNPGQVPAELTLGTAADLKLAEPPAWADERDEESDIRCDSLLLEPRRLRLNVDGYKSVVVLLQHRRTGKERVPAILSVAHGRCAVVTFEWETIAQAPILVTRGATQTLQSVWLDWRPAAVQAVELCNDGDASCEWKLAVEKDKSSWRRHEIVSFAPQRGTLPPHAATHVHVRFAPLEEAEYEFPVTLSWNESRKQKDPTSPGGRLVLPARASSSSFPLSPEAEVAVSREELPDHLGSDPASSCLLLKARGVADRQVKREEAKPSLPAFLRNNAAVVPVASLARLSAETLLLHAVPSKCLIHRFLILRNNDSTRVLRFAWDQQNLFPTPGSLTIVPAEGHVAPAGHEIIHFVFRTPSEPLHLDGEDGRKQRSRPSTVPCLYLLPLKPCVALFVRIQIDVDPRLPSSSSSFLAIPPPLYPPRTEVCSDRRSHTLEPTGSADSLVSSQFRRATNSEASPLVLSHFAATLIADVVTEMIHAAMQSEHTAHIVDTLLAEPSICFKDIAENAILTSLSKRNETTQNARDHELVNERTPVLRNHGDSRKIDNGRLDAASTPQVPGLSFHEDFQNWSCLVANFLDCVPTLKGTLESEPENGGPSPARVDEKLEVLLARDRNLFVDVLPVTVSDIFRHLILSAIKDVMCLHTPDLGLVAHSPARESTLCEQREREDCATS
uniref:Abnormal spindle-like microcephaly-associated protein ASH domain-containing protein n=1 Tax=Neospora caninum (strain Liverpool) TaxID=572307 RepID=A0A0F7U483_NEOCL|nr:TPA: hypothetical protein BN1204_004800 [Neospora caninum Liverpool]